MRQGTERPPKEKKLKKLGHRGKVIILILTGTAALLRVMEKWTWNKVWPSWHVPAAHPCPGRVRDSPRRACTRFPGAELTTTCSSSHRAHHGKEKFISKNRSSLVSFIAPASTCLRSWVVRPQNKINTVCRGPEAKLQLRHLGENGRSIQKDHRNWKNWRKSSKGSLTALL